MRPMLELPSPIMQGGRSKSALTENRTPALSIGSSHVTTSLHYQCRGCPPATTRESTSSSRWTSAQLPCQFIPWSPRIIRHDQQDFQSSRLQDSQTRSYQNENTPNNTQGMRSWSSTRSSTDEWTVVGTNRAGCRLKRASGTAPSTGRRGSDHCALRTRTPRQSLLRESLVC